MPFIPEDKIQEIRDRVSIVSVISKYVSLKKAGLNHKGLCPFHAEKTSSFVVSETKKIFHCFGCAKGGNVFSFLMEHNGLSFPEAVEKLANEIGMVLPKGVQSPRAQENQQAKQDLFKANIREMRFYEAELSKNKQALDYFLKRGLKKEIIQKYHLGYAPNRSSDRFRHRVIFPLIDVSDRVLGFAGRSLRDEYQPKYLNSAESLIFNKRKSLYGYAQGVRKISQEGAIIVEGYFDCLMLHQFGFQNAVATMGTALTPEHIQTLMRVTKEFFVLFDSDEAGFKAAERSLPLFLEQGISPRMIQLPSGLDPDDFILREGKEAFVQKIKNARSLIEFVMDRYNPSPSLSAQKKTHILEELSKLIENLPSKIEREEMIRKLADRLQIQESLVHESLKSGLGRSASRQAPWKQQLMSNWDPVEMEVLEFFMLFPKWLKSKETQKSLDLLVDPELKSVALMILEQVQHQETIDFSEILSKIKPLTLQSRLREGVLKKETQTQSQDAWQTTFEACVKRLKRKQIEIKEKELLRKIEKMDQDVQGDAQKNELLNEYHKLVKQKLNTL